ncbi:MAG: Ig-like domain-containing protein [Gemmatimonadales bacterium]
MRVVFHQAVFAGIVAIAAACGSDQTGPTPNPNPPADPVVASVGVSPEDQIMLIGATATLQATAKTAGGQTVTGRNVTWSVDSSRVATVSAQGLVTAVAEGVATISAVIDGKKGSARVQVTPPNGTVVRVDLDVVAVNLAERTSQRIVATPRDATGTPIQGLGITWLSSAPDVAMVEPDGSVTAIRPGTVFVTARVHGVTATATVQVTGIHTADLLFSRYDAVGVEPEMLLIDLRDSTRTPQPIVPGGLRGYQPTPSPDGTKIAFMVIDGWGQRDLRILDRTTGQVSDLTTGYQSDDSPTWSPDGTRIAFRRHTGGASHIWVINLDRTSLVDLNQGEPGTFDDPAWSPVVNGGSRIAYARSLNGGGTLWTMATDGSDKRQVTSNPGYYDQEPAWSPDGQQLAFSRVGGVSRNIWIVNAAGGSERAVVSLPLHQFGPAWSPDGSLIAFISGHNGGADVYTVPVTGRALVAGRTADGLAKGGLRWMARP